MSLLETVSGLAVRHLKPERLEAVRSGYLSLRKKMHPLMRAVYGTFDTRALRAHLEERIGTNYEILMVHSSVNHMKPMFTEGPLDLVKMLIDFCGAERTLTMPAYYFGDPAIGGASATFRQRPRFDLRRTPSQMGLATELFRRMPGVVQSRHPVYRTSALGPLAQALTVDHELAASPSGRGTPFDVMSNRDTVILGIGKSMQVMTQAHYVEQLLGEDYPVPGRPGSTIDMVLVDGKVETPLALSTGRSFEGRFNIWKLVKMMPPGTLHQWEFHHVPMFAARAADVTAAMIAAAKRGESLYEQA